MKKILAMLLVLVMALSLVACGAKAPAEAPAADVAMQYIKADEAKTLLENDEYVFFDIRRLLTPLLTPSSALWLMIWTLQRKATLRPARLP